MIRVADYIAETIASFGISHVFMVTGGGAMHLNDAFGRCKAIKTVFCHHEQSCAIAAEGFYRATDRIAAVNVTTGPGATNAITGVFGAYVDSIPMIIVSGQSKWETLVRSTNLPLRQLGDQEVDIVRMVEGITKYAVILDDPDMVRYNMERALHLATTGRPGPVWLDVPINVQATLIDPKILRPYDPNEDRIDFATQNLDLACDTILSQIAGSKRPCIYAGSGVRRSGKLPLFLDLANSLKIPIVTAWNNNDLIPDESPYFAGRPGSVGTRAGNFTVQNADLLLILGCRLNIRLISYNWENFARSAYKIWIDVDKAELSKPTVKPNLAIHADLRDLLPILTEKAKSYSPRHGDWLKWCRERVNRYPAVLPEYWQKESPINPYCFMDKLWNHLNSDDTVVVADGTACVAAFQVARIRTGMRLFHNSGSAPMGFDLPAAIGAAIARGQSSRIICIAGDGSIMMNLQELQTIKGGNLEIKIFVLNNSGYHSIRQTQSNYFPDNIVGCGIESGLSFPKWEKIAYGFEIPFNRCTNHPDLDQVISVALQTPGPTLTEIELNLEQPFAPKLSSRKLDDGRMVSAPLEDMAPFLPRAEFKENMIVPTLKESN